MLQILKNFRLVLLLAVSYLLMGPKNNWASASVVGNLRDAIINKSPKVDFSASSKVENVFSHQLYNNKKLSGAYEFGNDDSRVKSVNFVFDKRNGKKYDSISGANGSLASNTPYDYIYATIDDYLYLETFGDLVYSNFTKYARGSSSSNYELYLFYLPLNLYSTFSAFTTDWPTGVNFSNYYNSDNKTIFSGIYENYVDINTLGADGNILKDLVDEAIANYCMTDSDKNTKEGFVKLIRYIYPSAFVGFKTIELEVPHLLWLLRDGLGYSEDEVKQYLIDYLNGKGRKDLIPWIQSSVINAIQGAIQTGNPALIANSPVAISYLSGFFVPLLTIHKIHQRNLFEQVTLIRGGGNGFNFHLGYNNGNSYTSGNGGSSQMGNNLSFIATYGHSLYKNYGFIVSATYNGNWDSIQNYDINTQSLGVGLEINGHFSFGQLGKTKSAKNRNKQKNSGKNNTVHSIPVDGDFGFGTLVSFGVNGTDGVFKNKNNMDFSRMNITAYLRNTTTMRFNRLLLTSIKFYPMLTYTNYRYSKIKFDSMPIGDINYNLFTFNFDTDFVKSFRIGRSTRGDVALNVWWFNYFHRPQIKFASVAFKNVEEKLFGIGTGIKLGFRFGKTWGINFNVGMNFIEEDYYMGFGVGAKL